ncbi:MAG: ExbD/TolR family protein, partial [Planctomycetota bacterium]
MSKRSVQKSLLALMAAVAFALPGCESTPEHTDGPPPENGMTVAATDSVNVSVEGDGSLTVDGAATDEAQIGEVLKERRAAIVGDGGTPSLN